MEKNSGPLVSAIIPTYGRPDLLRGAVESVLAQTYSNIELLVVDDHSPTPAKTILSTISTANLQSIRIIRHDENQGANVARNTGIENASGDLIAFLDDDDRWDQNKIKRQVATFQGVRDTVGVVYTGQRFINDNGEITSIRLSEVRGDVTKQLLCGAKIASFSSIMVRSGIIQQAGLPDERFPCWQDREWYVRLSRYCEFESIPEPLVIRRVGDHDRIGDNYTKKRDEACPLFVEKHQPLAAEYGRICKRKMKAALTRKLGKTAIRQEKYRDARKQLMKSIIYYPFFWKSYLYFVVSIGGNRGYKIASKCKRWYEKITYSMNITDI